MFRGWNRTRFGRDGVGLVVLLAAIATACAFGLLAGPGQTAAGAARAVRVEGPALFGVVGATVGGASGSTVKLRTSGCPTKAAVGGGRIKVPARVAVRSPAGSPALRAYAASNGVFLPAPPRWECTASYGVDGTEEIAAAPHGSIVGGGTYDPHLRKGRPSVQATLIPACQGCIAEAICSFFPAASVVKAYESTLTCEEERAGELRERISPSAVLFYDPPGVAGFTGQSGGPLPSVGVISYKRETGARVLSCTVPASQESACAAAIVAFLDLGGRR
jgi:hypothetical protein